MTRPTLRDAVLIGATWLAGLVFAGGAWLAAYRLVTG